MFFGWFNCFTSASAKQYLPGQFSTRCRTVSATLQSTLTGSQAPGPRNSLQTRKHTNHSNCIAIKHFLKQCTEAATLEFFRLSCMKLTYKYFESQDQYPFLLSFSTADTLPKICKTKTCNKKM